MLRITSTIPFDFKGSFSLKVGENEIPKSKIYPDAARHIAHLAKHGVLVVVDHSGEDLAALASEPAPIAPPCAACARINTDGGPVVPCRACFIAAGYPEDAYNDFAGNRRRDTIPAPPMGPDDDEPPTDPAARLAPVEPAVHGVPFIAFADEGAPFEPPAKPKKAKR